MESKTNATNYANIQVAGFKSNVGNFKELMQGLHDLNLNCTVQLMDAEAVAGKGHAFSAALQALNAFKREENIAKDLGLEICLRASAQRQISRALDVLGIKDGEMNICAVAVGCTFDVMAKIEGVVGKRDDDVLEPDEPLLKELYNLQDSEIEAAGTITRVLIERTALLVIDK
ncbi:KEOPS complex subunit Cgi121 [Methanobacterium congolense]|uniref:Regulatory protein Cgi121 n=1 Tax=Methanobacterium congolense TaxID=118062 RepID=A0A1D3L029_9EURY|nr:KEOPS complex subunit Cgi121 [Methanobacterium congolense]SCG84893.1 Regulatory protein Cgi121 [Methanobacterium congolense]